MLFDILLGIILIPFLYFIGFLFTSKVNMDKRYADILRVVIGLISVILISNWIYYLRAPKLIAFLVFITLLIFGFITYLKNFDTTSSFQKPKFWQTTSLFVILSFALNPTLMQSAYRFRIGPDRAGWLASSHFYANGGSIEALKNSIVEQSKNPEVYEVFTYPFKDTLAIDQIPSFRDQIVGEFLVGANRTGLPALNSLFESIAGIEGLIRFQNAFILLNALLLFKLLKNFVGDNTKNSKIQFIIPLLSVLSYAYLGPILEGGIGGVLPVLLLTLLIVAFLQNSETKNLVLIFWLSLIYSLTTYFEFVNILVPCMLILIMVRFRKEKLQKNFVSFNSILAAGTLVLAFPNLSSVERLLKNTFTGVNVGGWSPGNSPSFGSFIGIHNWISAEGIDVTPVDYKAYVLASIVGVVLCSIGFTTLPKYRGFILTLFFVYASLIVKFVFFTAESRNSYIFFKLSPYFAVLVPSILFIVFQKIRETCNNRIKSTHRIATIVLSGAMIISNASFFFDWIQNTQEIKLTIPSAELLQIEKIYDLEFIGFSPSSILPTFAILSNPTFVSPSRGYGHKTLRSEPSKTLAYVIPVAKRCNSLRTLDKSTRSSIKYEQIISESEIRICRVSDK
jgi:hypothetical protein